MSLTAHIEVTKHNRFTGSDETTVVHHVDGLSDEACAMKTGKVEFGAVVQGLDGQDPHDVLRRLPDMEAALDPEQRRLVGGFLLSLEAACKWVQRVRVMPRRSAINHLEQSDGRTTVADLYQNDFRLVIKG